MRKLLLPLIMMLFAFGANAQNNVGIGTTTPRPSAKLEVNSNNQGILIPRVDTTQMLGLTALDNGLIVFDTIVNSGAGDMFVWTGTHFVSLTQGGGSSPAWELGGNAGTVDGTNFIGTTDNIPLNFRVNNVPAGRIDHILFNAALGRSTLQSNTTGQHNTAIGNNAMITNSTGFHNAALGSQALQNGNSTGNVAVGYRSLLGSTSGGNNTAVGYQSGNTNTTGSLNTLLGYDADVSSNNLTNATAIGANAIVSQDNSLVLGDNVNVGIGTSAPAHRLDIASGNVNIDLSHAYLQDGQNLISRSPLNDNLRLGPNTGQGLTTGTENILMGFATGNSIQDGNSNIAMGWNAIPATTSGGFNVAIGRLVGLSNTTGTANIGIGGEAIHNNVSGNENIGLGVDALYSNSTGNQNIAIGAGADVISTGLNNAVAIGALSRVDANNSIVLGMINGVGPGVADVSVGIGTATPNQNASLDLGHNDRGLQLNRVNRTTFAPSLGAADRGMLVYDTIDNGIYVWTGSAFEAAGSGSNDTIPANVFSARIDGGAATPDANRVLSENVSFIQSVTRTAVGSYTIIFNAGFFLETPSISAVVTDPGLGPLDASVVGPSNTGFIVRVGVSGSGLGDHNFQVTAINQGSDFQNSVTAIGQWDVNGSDLSYTSGNIGIGTNAPSAALSIQTIGGTELDFPAGAGNVDIQATNQMNIETTSFLQLSGSSARLAGGSNDLQINSDGAALGGFLPIPNANADLNLTSNNKGLQLNRVNRTTFAPSLGAEDRGMLVYDTIDNGIYVWTGSAFEAAGSGANDTIPENVFSARISGAGVLISENVNFIQSINRISAGRYQISFIPGFFTEIPSVVTELSAGSIAGYESNTVSTTTSGTQVLCYIPNSSYIDREFTLIVQRQGADYQASLTAPPNVIGQWDINGSDLSYTSGNVGIGTNAPAELLQVNSTSGVTVASRYTNSNTGSTGSDGFAFGISGTGNAFINNDEATPINISTSSVTRMTIGATGNVGIGTTTPSARLEVSGGDALVNGHTLGRGAGNVSSNTVFGVGALSSNTTGNNNVSIGVNSLAAMDGDRNTSMGSGAMQGVTSGTNNVAIGYDALNAAGTQSNSVAIGFDALGSSAGTGGNTAVGVSAGVTNTNGFANTFIGQNADASAGGLTNATAIGNGAVVGASNALVLGNNANVGMGLSTPQEALHVNSAAAATSLIITNDATGVSNVDGLRLGTNNTGLGILFNNENAQLLIGTSALNQLVLDPGGFIGIGQTTPTEALDINGNLKFAGALMPNNQPGAAGDVLTSAGPGLPPTWGPGGGSGWGLSGNAGTVDGTNFIGTTDAVALNFRVDNQPSGRIDDASSAITTFGYQAGNNGAGIDNAAFGFRTLASNTGDGNFAFGSRALENNTIGDANIAIGFAALNGNIDGGQNVAIGNGSQDANANGFDNTSVGWSTLLNNTSSGNTAIGSLALNATDGQGNTGVGYNAMATNINGTFNTAVGHGADVAIPGLANATAIGYNAVVGASNSLVLGGTGADAVFVGIGTQTPTVQLEIEAVTPRLRLSSTNNSSEIRFENTSSGVIGTIGDPGSSEDLSIAAQNRIFFTGGFSGTAMTVGSTGNIGIGTVSPLVSLHVDATDAAIIPDGTTAQRPAATVGAGAIRYNSDIGTLEYSDGTQWHSLVPPGTIVPFGGNTPPEGWLLCNGAIYARATYPNLFAAIGTAWGTTNASDFRVPDARGKFLRGVDAGAGFDPFVGSRIAQYTGGNGGDAVGSFQFGLNAAAGGLEGRPVNVNVNYIIKY